MEEGKTLYSIYDPVTRIVMHAVFAEVPPVHSSPILVTEPWAKPQFNADFTEIINIATAEEQAAYEKRFDPSPTIESE